MAEEAKCSNCKRSDSEEKLIKFRHRGKEDYVCVHCLPYFIHG